MTLFLFLISLNNKNSEWIIIGHLNINFIENKFNSLVSLVKDDLDIIMIYETKIDESFPETQILRLYENIQEGSRLTGWGIINLCAG